MELYAILYSFLNTVKPFWWYVPIIVLIVILKSPWGKGYVGELYVRLMARLWLPKKTYRAVHNVTLPTDDGTTQIDHVILSPFGIFVLETKNRKGWIYGSENDARWTRTVFKKSFTFQNPLRQNAKHVKALEAALHTPPGTVHSIIAFVGDSTFKTPMPANVTRRARFIRYIKSFRARVFTEAEVQALLERLETVRLAPTVATHREYVRNVRAVIRTSAVGNGRQGDAHS